MPEEIRREIATDTRLERARQNVLDWLANRDRGPATSEVSSVGTVIQSFLQSVSKAGFACQVVEINAEGKVAYEVHWTHQGASFVGFKQPPAEDSPEDALLAGCAALLQNEWCRSRLDKTVD